MNWPETRFGTLFIEPSRNGLYKAKEFHGSGVKIINMGELFAYPFVGAQEMKRLQVTKAELARMAVADGDLLFARRSLIESGAGKCVIVEKLTEPTVFESSIIRVRLNTERFFPRYYYYYFLSAVGRSRIEAIITGAAQKGIRGSELAEIQVHTPTLAIQRRIASILSAYDDLIENNMRRIAILEEMTRRIYEEWFVRFRFPGHEQVKMVESELGAIPEGWRHGPIRELYEGLFDGPHATPTPSDEGPVFLGIGNITERGQLDISSTRHINEADFPKWTKRVRPQPGDIVFTYEATLNRYALIPHGFRGCLGRRLALIRTKPEDSSNLYLYCTFFSQAWREVIAQQTLSGATVDRIPLSRFPSFPITIPPQKTLSQFEEMVRPMFDQMEILNRKNTNLRTTRNLLLSKLISGELSCHKQPERSPME